MHLKNGNHVPISYLLVAIAVLLAAGLACDLGPSATPAALTTGGPTVTLTSPVPGQKLPVGQAVAVNSTSVDSDGVQRVELWVDGAPVRVDSNPAPSSPYIVSQTWQGSAAGTHVIQVKAFDAKGAQGQSQSVVVTLEATAQQTLPESTPAAQASPAAGGQEPPPTWTLTPAPLQPTWTPTVPPPPATWTPTPPKVTNTPLVVCTPPPCKKGEVYYCPGDCPGGCGTQCATPTVTPTPPSYKPTGIDPHSIFKPVWDKPGVKDYIGYPTQAASDNQHYARQFFDHGFMYWWENKPNAAGSIWVVEMTQSSTRQGSRWSGPYADTWKGDAYSCDAARSNPDGPVRGFGKVWCDHADIAKALGDAREGERGTGETASYGAVQVFQGGIMLFSPLDREVWVLFTGGAWQRYSR